MLEFHYGTVSSKKTADLLISAHQYPSAIILKSTIDTRYGKNIVGSRVPGLKKTANFCISIDEQIPVEEIKYLNPSIVFVDECQFFSVEQIESLHKLSYFVNVVCYGLNTDFKRRLFPASKRLFELADNKVELKTPCYKCSAKKSIFSHKLKKRKCDLDREKEFSQDDIEIGCEELYIPVCSRCFDSLNDL